MALIYTYSVSVLESDDGDRLSRLEGQQTVITPCIALENHILAAKLADARELRARIYRVGRAVQIQRGPSLKRALATNGG